jgi:hypothetical protein
LALQKSRLRGIARLGDSVNPTEEGMAVQTRSPSLHEFSDIENVVGSVDDGVSLVRNSPTSQCDRVANPLFENNRRKSVLRHPFPACLTLGSARFVQGTDEQKQIAADRECPGQYIFATDGVGVQQVVDVLSRKHAPQNVHRVLHPARNVPYILGLQE